MAGKSEVSFEILVKWGQRGERQRDVRCEVFQRLWTSRGVGTRKKKETLDSSATVIALCLWEYKYSSPFKLPSPYWHFYTNVQSTLDLNTNATINHSTQGLIMPLS